jgi:hypothetical protein
MILSNTRLFSLVLLFFCCANAAVAQPNSPTATAKYIFYWSSLQADLLQTNQYKAEIRTTYNTFRQAIFQQPKIWNGKKIQRTFTFEVNGFQMRTDSVPMNYNGHVAAIDENVGKSIRTGDTIRVRQITLDGGLVGSIDIILESAPPKDIIRYDGPITYYSFNPVLLTSFKWESVVHTDLGNNLKEFYTAQEVKGLLKVVPSWSFATDTGTLPTMQLRTTIKREEQNMQFLVPLDSARFLHELATLITPYEFLLAPGSEIQFEVMKDIYVGPELRVVIQIVEEKDPRRKLKPSERKKVEIFWGDFSGDFGLYLQTFKNQRDEVLHADGPSINRLSQNTWSAGPIPAEGDGEAKFAERKRLERMLQTRPIFKVNGKEMTSFSFTLVVNNKTYEVGASELIPQEVADNLLALKAQNGARQIDILTIKSIRNDMGFDFDLAEFVLYLRRQ